MKIKILYRADMWSNLSADFLLPFYNDQFNLEVLDQNKTYDKSSCVIYTHWINSEWTNVWHDKGYKIVIDHLWDPWANLELIKSQENKLVLRSDGWFCIANECLWYKSMGLDSYASKSMNNKTFLMLMNYQKSHRDLIWSKIQPYLSNALYSYRDKKISLDNDINREDPRWQRYVNPDWYDQTMYSLVVETGIESSPMVHSEKALKPFAFKHPMIVWGPPGYLQWLRSWGFQTFNHYIDESYDLEQDHGKRLDMIITEVARLNSVSKDYFVQDAVKEILDHNYNRFYDTDWAKQQFKEKVIDIIKDFAE